MSKVWKEGERLLLHLAFMYGIMDWVCEKVVNFTRYRGEINNKLQEICLMRGK